MPCVRNDVAARRAPPKPKPTGAPARSRVFDGLRQQEVARQRAEEARRQRLLAVVAGGHPTDAPVTVVGPGPGAAAAVRIADEFLTASALAADFDPLATIAAAAAPAAAAAAAAERVAAAAAAAAAIVPPPAAVIGGAEPGGLAGEAQRAGRDGGRRVRHRLASMWGPPSGGGVRSRARSRARPAAPLSRARRSSFSSGHRDPGRSQSTPYRIPARQDAPREGRSPTRRVVQIVGDIQEDGSRGGGGAPRHHQARGRVGGAARRRHQPGKLPLDELGTTKGAAERLAAAQAGVVGLNKTTTKGWVAEYGADGTPLATAGFDAWENKWVQTGADAPPGTPPAEKPDAASVPALAEALAELGSVAVPTELVSQAFGYAEEDEGAPAAPDESPMKVAESL